MASSPFFSATASCLQALPQVLRQGRARVEHHVQVAEEVAPQGRVILQMRQQKVEAARHVEVHGRRDLAQVARGDVDQARRGLAAVHVQRAAVPQDHVEAEIAAEGVVPGQPVDDGLHAVLEERPDLRQHLLVGDQHALRVDHALGQAGGAGGEEDLRHRVRAHAREGLVHAGAGRRVEELARSVWPARRRRRARARTSPGRPPRPGRAAADRRLPSAWRSPST